MSEHHQLPPIPTGPDLLAAVQAAGNHLVIPDPDGAFRAACRRAIHAIFTGDLVPTGFRLRYTGRNRGDLVLSIVAIEDAPRPPDPLPSIPIPESLRGCHPIISATREVIGNRKTGWIDTHHQKGVAHVRIHPGNLKRSLLILQAMVAESQRRGFDVKTGGRCEGLVLVVDGYPQEIAIKEETSRSPHEPTPAEQKQIDKGYSWGVPKWDVEPTGRLVLLLGHESYTMKTLAADRQRWKLEDKLATAFEKLSAESEKARLRDEERARVEQRRQEAWQAAMDAARVEYVDHKRTEWLSDQLCRWRDARDLRECVTAVGERMGLSVDDREWLTWIEARADNIDPSRRRIAPPPPPEPGPEDLKPFLHGISPYGTRGW